jgi:hypothetical protein
MPKRLNEASTWIPIAGIAAINPDDELRHCRRRRSKTDEPTQKRRDGRPEGNNSVAASDSKGRSRRTGAGVRSATTLRPSRAGNADRDTATGGVNADKYQSGLIP